MQDQGLLTSKEVQKLLNCSSAWVYKASATGLLPCVRIPCPGLGTQKKELVRFKRQDVFDFIEAHYTKANR